jgi:hypothetical protein
MSDCQKNAAQSRIAEQIADYGESVLPPIIGKDPQGIGNSSFHQSDGDQRCTAKTDRHDTRERENAEDKKTAYFPIAIVGGFITGLILATFIFWNMGHLTP